MGSGQTDSDGGNDEGISELDPDHLRCHIDLLEPAEPVRD